ncbi:hypothetical protein E4U13_004671 [Claviceps humidiphila]|uniref:Defect at low temperature protein 1 n=1 Tax=Claviceps humidiphila TaxID=1294629 RepID=A0A9P7Q6B3_9HYPO|nr:hypothetical protein E4U13_004671 [Claviceps humidiphila]
MRYQRLFLRILYGSIYVLLILVLIALLLVTPADAIKRSLRNGQNYNVTILTISYVVTVTIVIFVYILRLYINKTALASIPKAWVPIDKGDVKDAVYRMIHSGLSRSAVISYAARPRDVALDLDGKLGTGDGSNRPRAEQDTVRTRSEKAVGEDGSGGLALPSLPLQGRPDWDEIEHDGWASPKCPDLRNLQYSSVLCELPHLIEAKALALASPRHSVDGHAVGGQARVLGAEVAALLQRMPFMTMSDYLGHLSQLGVLPPVDDESMTSLFLDRYEYARFSNRPLSNQRFRELMHLFAEVLRAMQPIDPRVLQSPYQDGDGDDDNDGDNENENDTSYGWGPSESDADIDNDAPLYTNPPSPRSSISRSTMSSVRRHPRPSLHRRTPSARAWSYYTAPISPGSRRPDTGTGAGMLSRTSSADNNGATTFAPTRRLQQQQQHTVGGQPPSSSSSLCSKDSTRSGGSGSVIRLATRDDPDALPYVLNLRPTT